MNYQINKDILNFIAKDNEVHIIDEINQINGYSNYPMWFCYKDDGNVQILVCPWDQELVYYLENQWITEAEAIQRINIIKRIKAFL